MTEFLAVTDLHFCEREITGNERRNNLSVIKLKEALKSCGPDCDFILNLGDTADSQPGYGDQETLAREVYGVLSSAGKPVHCLIGNHDTSLPKDKLTGILGMPGRYYKFETEDFIFIALDGNMNSPDEPLPGEEIEWGKTYLDPAQLKWLAKALDEADKDVIILSHELFMLHSYGEDNPHVLRNRDAAVELFEKSGKVKAVICGHYHYGDIVRHGGIYYIALTAMVNYESANYSVIRACKGRIEIEGHGLQQTMTLELE